MRGMARLASEWSLSLRGAHPLSVVPSFKSTQHTHRKSEMETNKSKTTVPGCRKKDFHRVKNKIKPLWKKNKRPIIPENSTLPPSSATTVTANSFSPCSQLIYFQLIEPVLIQSVIACIWSPRPRDMLILLRRHHLTPTWEDSTIPCEVHILTKKKSYCHF